MTQEEAIALVRSAGVIPFTHVEGAHPSFVDAVAGERVRGSWWGHPQGHDIYNFAGAAARESIFVKLIAGKETLVHRALWPEFARVVTDERWRRPRVARLAPGARRLLGAVEAAPPLRLDEHARGARKDTKEGRRELAKLRRDLERALLVRSDDLHTERGRHTTVLEPWSAWVAREKLAAAAKKLSLEAALERLRSACGPVPTALDEART
jgi:hypothetical protein